MPRCPRCDNRVERLRTVPEGLLGVEAAAEAAAVCRGCLNEMREG